jgi:uncharacterized protein involved in tellurium resistance
MSRHAEAVQSQRQARAVYQELAITDPRYLAQLSQATSTLNDRLTRAQSASGEQTAAADRASTVTWQDVTGTFRTLRAGHVWSFSSHDVTSGRLHVELSSATFPSLRWRQGRRRRDTTVAEPHLTLGCLFELTNGTRGLIHEPTEQEVDAYRQWPYTKVPFDWLYRDVDVEDRITLDLGHAMDLRRLLFFAVIRSEAFHRADARMTFVVDRQAALAIRLEQAPRSAQSCAVALLSRHRKELVLHSELHYSPGDPSTLDERYGWGLDWSENELPGSSRP